jgi:hypothetical protein
LGFYDKYNFVWFLAAFTVGIITCYPKSVLTLWNSLPRLARWLAILLILIGFGVMARLFLPLLFYFRPTNVHTAGLEVKWSSLINTLSGQAVAGFIFGNANGIIPHVFLWLVIADLCLALGCLLSPTLDSRARENRRNGFFCLLVAALIFIQIVITPQAGGPHHYSMIFPLHLLAFAFLAKSLYDQIASKCLQRLAAVVLAVAAISVFVINVHNTAVYLSHFRTNPHYNPRWSPEIYSFSTYINEHGFEVKRIISADWGLHAQLHALAPKKLRPRMRNLWPTFMQLRQKTPEQRSKIARNFFPKGKNFVLTFAPSKGTFGETRENLLAVIFLTISRTM